MVGRHEEAKLSMTTDFDAIVVGAGFAGLYMLHRLRGEGFRVRVYEAGAGIGGTWYWNRYPGARCDVESMQYSYQFSEELQQEWDWSEKYATQPEILAYAEHVADRFDLHRDIQLNTTVAAAHYDEISDCWCLELGDGAVVTARYCVMALGCLSTTNKPAFAGLEDFQGAVYHTGEWPHEGVDFTGARVGIIGTGSSAIQTIPVIAEQAAHLTVFQRTPNFAIPAYNAPLEPDEVRAIKADYAGLRSKAKARPTGVYFQSNDFSAQAIEEEARTKIYQEYWDRGGLSFLGAFNDLLLDEASNDTAAAFVRGKIREKVADPQIAALLAPDTIIGCKRLCVDSGYFETFNRDNVTLVDISEDPIDGFTATGLTIAGKAHTFDAAVFATGFDAMTGSFTRIDIRGRGGLPLVKKWEAGPRTFLGLATAGFPNMFMITGPGSPSVLASMIQTIEQHVEWIIDCMGHMRDHDHTMIEADVTHEDAWVDHVNEAAAGSLRSTCSSWYLGGSIPGRPRVFMPYIGGFPIYVEKCDSVAAAAYEGFHLA